MEYLTRGDLGLFLSAQMSTRTVHFYQYESGLDIGDDWIVRYLDMAAPGVLRIHCEAPR